MNKIRLHCVEGNCSVKKHIYANLFRRQKKIVLSQTSVVWNEIWLPGNFDWLRDCGQVETGYHKQLM